MGKKMNWFDTYSNYFYFILSLRKNHLSKQGSKISVKNGTMDLCMYMYDQ